MTTSKKTPDWACYGARPLTPKEVAAEKKLIAQLRKQGQPQRAEKEERACTS